MNPFEAVAILGTVSIIALTAYGVIRVVANAWAHKTALRAAPQDELLDAIDRLQSEIDSLREESADRWDDLETRLDFSERLLGGESTGKERKQGSSVIGLTPV